MAAALKLRHCHAMHTMLTGVVDEYVESTVRAVNALCQTMDRAPVTEVQLFVCHSLVAARICIHTPIKHTPPITQSINQSITQLLQWSDQQNTSSGGFRGGGADRSGHGRPTPDKWQRYCIMATPSPVISRLQRRIHHHLSLQTRLAKTTRSHNAEIL